VVIVCPAVTCRLPHCFRHCNHCGKDIVWRPPLLDAEIAYKGPKPLDPDGTIHRCMLSGTKDHKWYNTHKVDNRIYYTPEDVEAMKDPIIKAQWEKQRQEWLEKWK
jgi:hypothetical protein